MNQHVRAAVSEKLERVKREIKRSTERLKQAGEELAAATACFDEYAAEEAALEAWLTEKM